MTRKAWSNTRPESRSCSARSGVWPCSLLNDTARLCAKVSLERLRPSPGTHPGWFQGLAYHVLLPVLTGNCTPSLRERESVNKQYVSHVRFTRGAEDIQDQIRSFSTKTLSKKKSSQEHVILFITLQQSFVLFQYKTFNLILSGNLFCFLQILNQ